MAHPRIFEFLLAGAMLNLAACGGAGGGVQSASGSPPPSPPPPASPPISAGQLMVFPGVTTSTDFAAQGYEGPTQGPSANLLTSSGFSVRYDASSGEYIFDLPASAPGTVSVAQTGERYWNGSLSGQPVGSGILAVNVFRPGPQNWDFPNLTYTSFAEYSTAAGRTGQVAFGQATAASAMPLTGAATFSAFAAGQTEQGYSVRGSATLQFNFGAGTLSGSFDPYIYDLLAGNTPLGHYDFANTVYGSGSTTFSGELARSGVADRGSFNGQFTGPGAEELMARWTAPLPNAGTNTTSQMFGVWVGRH